jgi:hypothetical protein
MSEKEKKVSSAHNVFSRDKESVSGFCEVCSVRGCKPKKCQSKPNHPPKKEGAPDA